MTPPAPGGRTPLSLSEVQVGAVVTRMLAGRLPMSLRVTALDEEFIHCGPWKFDRESGVEVDEELGWGPTFGRSGSYLLTPSSKD